jgi:tRNA (guanine10-N2)-methyltransferase
MAFRDTSKMQSYLEERIPANRNREADYIPPKKPYSFIAMLDDIMDFSAQYLVENGRLSLWMPTANEDFTELDIPTHPCLEVVSVCVQAFNKCKYPNKTSK